MGRAHGLILRHADAPELATVGGVGGRLASSLKLGDVTIDGWVKPLFDTYAQQPERNRQRHTASVGVVYRHGAVRVSGRYRGTPGWVWAPRARWTCASPTWSTSACASIELYFPSDERIPRHLRQPAVA